MSTGSRAGLAAAAALACLGAGWAWADDEVPLQRQLVSLYLGDSLKEVKILYPPTREWPTYKEGRLDRVHIERSYAKYFPDDVETLRLGMKRGRLVHIQVVFDAESSRRTPLSQMIVDLSINYGAPVRKGEIYFWKDRSTVLRAFNAELPSPDGSAIELRASLEIMDRGVARRLE